MCRLATYKAGQTPGRKSQLRLVWFLADLLQPYGRCRASITHTLPISNASVDVRRTEFRFWLYGTVAESTGEVSSSLTILDGTHMCCRP